MTIIGVFLNNATLNLHRAKLAFVFGQDASIRQVGSSFFSDLQGPWPVHRTQSAESRGAIGRVLPHPAVLGEIEREREMGVPRRTFK